VSPTVAIACSVRLSDALFRQVGVIRARSFSDLLDVPAALSTGRKLRGRRVAILTSTGGAGTLVSDDLGVAGFDTPAPDAATAQALRDLQTGSEAVLDRNPIDVTLAGLRPAFDKAGSVTAGNASGLNDGAAAVVVMSAKKAAALGLKPLARIAAFGTSGLDPATMGMGPVPASRKALQRAGWNAADVDLFELNEAFAAQACAVNNELAIDPAKVNENGGAIAIGHPIGASGCRIPVTSLHEMQRRDAQKGLDALCSGGGMGWSLALAR